MNDEQLDRLIRSIGKACSVKRYSQLSDFNTTNSDLSDLMMKKEGYTEPVCRTRVSKSRKIIREKKTKDALTMIIESERLSDHVRKDAEKILYSL